MHILQVHNSYRQRGGEDTVVAADARLLRSAGHAVTQYIVPNPVRSIETGMRLGLSLWNPAGWPTLPQDSLKSQSLTSCTSTTPGSL